MSDLDQAIAVSERILEGSDALRTPDLMRLLRKHSAHPLCAAAIRALEKPNQNQKHENTATNTPADAGTGPRVIGPRGPLPRVNRFARGSRAD